MFPSAEILRGLGYILLFLVVAPLFPFLYVVTRWRTGGAHEPGAGTYGALLYFRTAGLLLTVAGASNLTYGFISTTPVDEKLTRLSWGLFLGAALFMLLNTALGRLVDAATAAREARRVFGGFVAIMSGLVALFVLVMFFITVFEEVGESEAVRRADELKLYGTWTVYFLGLYLGSIWLLARGAKRQ